MPEYVRSWSTDNTVIKVSIQKQGETLVIERTRGRKRRTKKVTFKPNNFQEVVLAVREVVKQRPGKQLNNRLLVSMVDGGLGLLTIEWIPYWFGRCNALVVRGPLAGQCIAIQEDMALAFSIWLTALMLELIAIGQLSLQDNEFPKEADTY